MKRFILFLVMFLVMGCGICKRVQYVPVETKIDSIVVEKIIIGRTFDNGIICSGEQAVFIPKEDFNKVLDLFRKNGVVVVEDEASIKKFADTIFPENGPINRKIVGQSVQTIAKLADVEEPVFRKYHNPRFEAHPCRCPSTLRQHRRSPLPDI